MVAFGFIDNTVMLHAGNLIDLTFGVTFGLSTLAAAACGQVCSDSGGVLFGNYIFRAARWMGLPEPKFTPSQKALRVVTWTGNAGAAVGVFTGCCIGLVNLFIIDTNEAKEMKLYKKPDGLEFAVEVSNEDDETSTAITIEGPDREGVIASITTSLAIFGCKIHAMNGARGNMAEIMTGTLKEQEGQGMCFSFMVHKGGLQVDDDKLDGLGASIIKSMKDANNLNALSAMNEKVKSENNELEGRIAKLEEKIEKHKAMIKRRGTSLNQILTPTPAEE